MILELLSEIGAPGGRDTSGEIKERLLGICARSGVGDGYLSKTLKTEHEIQIRPAQKVFAAKPQIWLDHRSQADS